ncbi:RNA polymerase sigma factor [Lacipirellula sp.]|uniref:RNA polymerase sigma factor n=1 Tax=Lacipirellula sp. TaxID=2691419 RepID=UPI003D10BE97
MTDPVVFAAHFQDVYRRLTLVAAGVTGERQSAEDIVQEAAIVAFEKIEQFEPGSRFSAWMAEIVRRCALNYRRKVQHRRTYSTDPAIIAEVESDASVDKRSPIASNGGELVPDQTAFDDQVASALQTLSAEARSCLLLRVIENLTYAEISELLGIPEGTAMSHVHRSKSALRKQLSEEPQAKRQQR